MKPPEGRGRKWEATASAHGRVIRTTNQRGTHLSIVSHLETSSRSALNFCAWFLISPLQFRPYISPAVTEHRCPHNPGILLSCAVPCGLNHSLFLDMRTSSLRTSRKYLDGWGFTISFSAEVMVFKLNCEVSKDMLSGVGVLQGDDGTGLYSGS